MSPGDWIALAWGVSFWAYLSSRLAMWRVVADRDGVWVRGFLWVRHLSWDGVRLVELRRDGVLEFWGRGDEDAVRAGAFVPPVVYHRLRIRTAGPRLADLFTLMARHPELRPFRTARDGELGPPMALWALVALCLPAVDWFLLG
jgi:hypothetical protein